MKTKILSLILLLCSLSIGCVTHSTDRSVVGIITDKQHDPELTRRYILGTSGISDIKKPEAHWLKVKESNGKVYTVHMSTPRDVEAWQLLEVGDYWPQSR